MQTINIIILDTKYFVDNLNIFLKSKSFLTKYICTKVTVNSAITVPIEAPIAPKFHIKHIFITKFTIAPSTTEIVYSFCLFVGNRYCVPVTLLNPINNIIGLITLISIATLSYPCPKKIGTNVLDTEIKPNIIGKDNKNTILNDFFIYSATFFFSPLAYVLAILGSITVPNDVITVKSIFIIFCPCS